MSDTPKTDPVKWREIYSTTPGDYYADTIEAGDNGELRVSVGGKVVQTANIRSLLSALWPDTPPAVAGGSAAGVPPLTKYRIVQGATGPFLQSGAEVLPRHDVYLASEVDQALAALRGQLEASADEILRQHAEIDALRGQLAEAKAAYMDSVRQLGAELTALRGQLTEAGRVLDHYTEFAERARSDGARDLASGVGLVLRDVRAALARQEPQ